MVADLHGIDIRQPPAGPPPETIGEWVDPDVTARQKGLAFIVPVLPGQDDAGKAFARDAYVTRRTDLIELLKRVDLITLNDAEARQLTEEVNIVRAAKWIMKLGPRTVVIKKGEHGAFMFHGDQVFFAPAYPLESVFDPTGAGDSFAGGFMGYLAKTDDLSEANMRRAVVYGSVMGSFVVEGFSIARLLEIGPDDIARRVADFHRLVSFDATVS